ncbi:MAG: type II secretion system minor pseudopilin GspI [Alphaproteobacteria bacterium]|nr:type II secretion system minor pseudopilin GspI [Alphaproteobacteria bacterium]
MKPWQRSASGLTLIEVLVALVVLALALATASQAISGWLRAGQRQGETLRAQLCADNAMAELRLTRQMPGIGSRTRPCEQAGLTLSVRTEVSPTPNPSFFRIDVQVFTPQNPVLRVTSILGRY